MVRYEPEDIAVGLFAATFGGKVTRVRFLPLSYVIICCFLFIFSNRYMGCIIKIGIGMIRGHTKITIWSVFILVEIRNR